MTKLILSVALSMLFGMVAYALGASLAVVIVCSVFGLLAVPMFRSLDILIIAVLEILFS